MTTDKTDRFDTHHSGCLELPVDELLCRVKPMPPPEDFVIEDLTPEEGEAFLDAVRR